MSILNVNEWREIKCFANFPGSKKFPGTASAQIASSNQVLTSMGWGGPEGGGGWCQASSVSAPHGGNSARCTPDGQVAMSALGPGRACPKGFHRPQSSLRASCGVRSTDGCSGLCVPVWLGLRASGLCRGMRASWSAERGGGGDPRVCVPKTKNRPKRSCFMKFDFFPGEFFGGPGGGGGGGSSLKNALDLTASLRGD